jgi:NAD(P)H-dependent FMN reductase
MEKIKVAVILGTTREQRKSIHAANLVLAYGNSLENVEAFLVDPKDFRFNGDGNDPEGKDPRYSEIVEKADAFFIVVPEYNHSFPGSLKRMLDSELEPYIHKAVAFAGVSSGRFAGVRAIEQLVVAVRELGLVPTFTDMHFPRVQELFDAEGNLLDESYNKYLSNAWEELVWMATVLQYGRANVTSKYHV